MDVGQHYGAEGGLAMKRETKADLYRRLELANRLARELMDDMSEDLDSKKKRREICRRIVVATSKQGDVTC